MGEVEPSLARDNRSLRESMDIQSRFTRVAAEGVPEVNADMGTNATGSVTGRATDARREVGLKHASQVLMALGSGLAVLTGGFTLRRAPTV